MGGLHIQVVFKYRWFLDHTSFHFGLCLRLKLLQEYKQFFILASVACQFFMGYPYPSLVYCHIINIINIDVEQTCEISGIYKESIQSADLFNVGDWLPFSFYRSNVQYTHRQILLITERWKQPMALLGFGWIAEKFQPIGDVQKNRPLPKNIRTTN